MHEALNFQKDICMQAQTLPRSPLREKAATTRRLLGTRYPCQPLARCFHLSLRAEGASTVKNKFQGFAASLKSLIRGGMSLLGILRTSSHSMRGENSKGQSGWESRALGPGSVLAGRICLGAKKLSVRASLSPGGQCPAAWASRAFSAAPRAQSASAGRPERSV